jgi:hypothetical protein
MDNKIIIIGHPRCGSGYMAELFSTFGCNVKHEEWGENGISSWLFAVDPQDLKKLKASYAPYGPTRPEKVNSKYIIHYVRDPFNAIPSIIGEDSFMDSYIYRKRILQKKYGINLDEYSAVDKATVSFLLWNKMIEEQAPAITIRVENATEAVKAYLVKMGLGAKQVRQFPDKRNNSRPKINVDWTTLRKDLLFAIDRWCRDYGYPELTPRINPLHVQKPMQVIEKQSSLVAVDIPQNKTLNILKPRSRPQSRPQLIDNIETNKTLNLQRCTLNQLQVNKGFSIRTKPKIRF